MKLEEHKESLEQPSRSQQVEGYIYHEADSSSPVVKAELSGYHCP